MKTQNDPDARVNSENARPGSGANYRLVFETAPHGIVFQNTGGIVLSANPAAQRLLGLSPDQMQGRASIDYRWQSIHEDGSPLPGEAHPTLVALRTGQPMENVVIGVLNSAGEGTRWMNVSAVPLFRTGELQPYQVMSSFVDITERKQAEALLRESEEKYRLIFEHSPMGVLSFTGNGTIVNCNNNFAEIIGYPREGLIGLNMLNLPDKKLVAALQQALHGRSGSYEGIYHSVSADKRTPVRVLFAPMDVGGGRVRGGVGIVEDISERRSADLALQKSKRFLLDAQTVGHIGCYSLDLTLGIWESSETLDDIFGIDSDYPRDVQGWLDLVVADSRDEYRQYVMDTIQNLRSFDLEFRIIRRNDGQERWISGFGVLEFDDQGQTARLIGTMQDITERKQAENALRDSLQRNKALLNANPDMLFVFTADGRIVDTKAEHSDGLSCPLDVPLGKHVGDVLPPEIAQLTLERIAEVQRTGQLVQYTYALKLNGEQKDFESRLVPCGDDTFLAFVRDITERKRAEEERRQLQSQLHQAQKMESLGILAGGIAHDMNNVLGAILILATSNIEAQPEGSPTQRAFGTIIRATERGGKMLKGLLSFARQRPAEEREVNMNAILHEEVRLLERTTLSKVHLEMALATDLQPIRGDASALTNAFMNLSLNAMDAMPEQGTLTLRTRNVDSHWIEVQVEDTGCGMPKEILEKALDPFFTTKPEGKGTGLGLAMVYSTVKAHYGKIEIQSKPGLGTLVRVCFPICEPATRTHEPVSEPRSESSSRALNVLLVDDDELIQSSMQTLLETLGHTVATALSGEEALAKLEAGLHPEVVILDINMPGLGGAVTLTRLRALRPTVPVLLATGRANQAALNLVETHPNVTLLTKPFSMRELQQQLEPLGRG